MCSRSVLIVIKSSKRSRKKKEKSKRNAKDDIVEIVLQKKGRKREKNVQI